MAVNRALNARRDAGRRREDALDDPRVERAVAIDAAGDPARAAELRQTYVRLLAALDALPPELRASVVLVVLQGLSHAEAAVVQACPAGTIAWRIHEARARLRKAMASPRLAVPREASEVDALVTRLRLVPLPS
jgi:RNA polymerase sigma-70 factor (ECF subfamily)